MSSVPQNERKKLSVEQFQEYKKYLEFSRDSIYVFIHKSLLEETTFTIEEWIKAILESGVSENDIPEYQEFLNDQTKTMTGMSFQDCPSEEILAAFPPEMREDLIKLKKECIIGFNKNGVLSDLDNIDEIFEVCDRKLNEIQSRISQYDLSEIPPEMFFDLSHEGLRKIDFENTGARLDMKHLQGEILGSIQGCELLSFSDKCYSLYDAVSSVNDDGLKFLSIDESHIPVILDYYKGNKEKLNETFTYYEFFLTKPFVQKDYPWFVDAYIEYCMNNNFYHIGIIWKYLSEEIQEKHINVLKKYIEEEKNDGKHSISKQDQMYEDSHNTLFQLIKGTHPNVLKKVEKDMEKLFVQDDSNFDFKKYRTNLWMFLPETYKEETIFDVIQRHKGSFDDFSKLFQSCSSDVQRKLFPRVWETFLTEDDKTVKLGRLYDICTIEDGPYTYSALKGVIGEKEALKIYDALEEERTGHIVKISPISLKSLWLAFDKDTQKRFLTDVLLKKNDNQEFKDIWEKTETDIKREIYLEVLDSIDDENVALKKYFQGEAYFQLLDEIDREKENPPYFREDLEEKQLRKTEKEKVIKNDKLRYLKAFYYSMHLEIPDNIEEISEMFQEVELKAIEALRKENRIDSSNLEVIIEGIPKIGVKLIFSILNSNSSMIREHSRNLIAKLASLPETERESYYQKVADIFGKNLPEFIKLYKFYQLETFEKHKVGSKTNLPPTLQNAKSKRMQDRIVFADLFRIAIDSNNKSLRDFIQELKEGNEIYIKFVNTGEKTDSLSLEEQKIMKRFLKSLYLLYELTDSNSNDEKNNQKIIYTGNIEEDAKNISRKYSVNGRITDLPDQILRAIIGPFQEMYEGIDTISEIESYMKRKVQEANDYHRKLAEQTPIILEEGDLVEGVRKGVDVFQQILRNGLLAGDFLGADATVDCTPLGADFAIITEKNDGKTVNDQIKKTIASSYSDRLWLVVKGRGKVEYPNTDNETMAHRMTQYSSKDEIKRRIGARARNEYPRRKLEGYSGSPDNTHILIRTGIGVADIDYIIVNMWDKRYGYELAMSGIYIPVVDKRTGKILFTPEDYDKIREQMQGLDYYGTGDFKVDPSARTVQAKELVESLFEEDQEEPRNIREAIPKREKIVEAVKKALAVQEIGLDVRTELSRDVTPGFIELIDTGSTSRGTNMSGKGDFDYTLKLDKEILDNPVRLEIVKNALKQLFSDRGSASIETVAGDFRYKQVKIEGIEERIDLDITFMPKSEHVRYSTDMCISERLNRLKKTDPEGYRYTIANIVLAKQKLKEKGLYKKIRSDGATELGGLGGSGVETWILANGGSLLKAIDTFLDAAESSKSFEEFIEKYPIYDFGENHRLNANPHDSFVRGMNGEKFEEIKKKLREIRDELELLEKTEISKGFLDGVQGMAQTQTSTQIDSGMSDLGTATDRSQDSPKEKKHDITDGGE